MSKRFRDRLHYVALAFILFSGIVHLSLGIGGVIQPGSFGINTRVLGLLFVVAGITVFAIIIGYLRAVLPQTHTYILGAMMMVVFIIAYVDWHVVNFFESVIDQTTFASELSHAHTHEHGSHGPENGANSFIMDVSDHLRTDPLALVTKSVEAIAAIILSFLAIWRVDDG